MRTYGVTSGFYLQGVAENDLDKFRVSKTTDASKKI